MSVVVDAHQHFWIYGSYQTSWMEVPPYTGDSAFRPLRRSFQPDDLMPELKAAGVHCTVTVRAAPARLTARLKTMLCWQMPATMIGSPAWSAGRRLRV